MVAIKIYQKLLYQLCHNHSPTVDCLQNHMSFVGYSSGGQVASDVIIWGRILLTSKLFNLWNLFQGKNEQTCNHFDRPGQSKGWAWWWGSPRTRGPWRGRSLRTTNPCKRMKYEGRDYPLTSQGEVSLYLFSIPILVWLVLIHQIYIFFLLVCIKCYWNRRFAIPGVWVNACAQIFHLKTGFSHQVTSWGRSKWSSLVERFWARSWRHWMGRTPAFARTPGIALVASKIVNLEVSCSTYGDISTSV